MNLEINTMKKNLFLLIPSFLAITLQSAFAADLIITNYTEFAMTVVVKMEKNLPNGKTQPTGDLTLSFPAGTDDKPSRTKTRLPAVSGQIPFGKGPYTISEMQFKVDPPSYMIGAQTDIVFEWNLAFPSMQWNNQNFTLRNKENGADFNIEYSYYKGNYEVKLTKEGDASYSSSQR